MNNFYTEIYDALYKFGYHKNPKTTCSKGICELLSRTAEENENHIIRWNKERVSKNKTPAKFFNPRTSVEFDSVLDIGCSKGLAMNFFAKMGKRVAGIDPSIRAVNFVVNKLKMECQQATADCLPFGDNSFDVVISSDVFEHIREEDIDKSIDECYRVASRYTIHKVATGISLGVKNKSGTVARKTPFTRAGLGKKMDNIHLSVHPTEWWIERFLSRNKDAKLITRIHKTFVLEW